MTVCSCSTSPPPPLLNAQTSLLFLPRPAVFPRSSTNLLILGLLTYNSGLSNWLINAFNGEWLRTEKALPVERIGAGSRLR